MSVYMYTHYTDLCDLPIEYQILQQERDAILRDWLLKQKIGSFPKKLKKFEPLKSQFEEFTKTSDQLVIIFLHKKHHDAPEKQCFTLHKGEWKSYPDMKTAKAELYHLDKGTTVLNQYIDASENTIRLSIENL